jgi:hypothetical protein
MAVLVYRAELLEDLDATDPRFDTLPSSFIDAKEECRELLFVVLLLLLLLLLLVTPKMESSERVERVEDRLDPTGTGSKLIFVGILSYSSENKNPPLVDDFLLSNSPDLFGPSKE